MSAIKKLITETERTKLFHKARGKAGQIEALACNIRIRALQDAIEAITQGGTNES